MTYSLIDSGHFKKLEQIGPYTIVRPSLQAVWEPLLSQYKWSSADAIFSPQPNDRGQWIFNNKTNSVISIEKEGLQFELKLTPFGHLGIFPEQVSNWKILKEIIHGRPLNILNLFAYTGGVSLTCALAGAHVTHVDASKTTVDGARRNADLSGLSQAPIRWIVDDVSQFVAREKRRGKIYDAVILDPPSFGRGPKGQVWKVEENMIPLLKNIKDILCPDTQFILLSCHSPGYTPLALKNILRQLWTQPQYKFQSEEMIIMDQQNRVLPAGACCWMLKKDVELKPQ